MKINNQEFDELWNQYKERFGGKQLSTPMPDLFFVYKDKDGSNHSLGSLNNEEELIALFKKGLETNTDILLEFPVIDLSGKDGRLL